MVGRWVWRADGEAPPDALVEAVGGAGRPYAGLLARLVGNRGVREPEAARAFLRPSLAEGLRSPRLLKDMDRAAARLADALAAGERIAVYGDYDVDGVTGAAQLMLCLRELGAQPLLHVSHRQREGYGLNADVLRALRAAGARVVVTADCGTGSPRELALAAELGLDVIVCDHHHAPAVRPPVCALLNPLQADCGFPFKGLSGAGVVFYLLMGLRMELRARGAACLPDLRRLLDLVALGTVADVVPLREENRVLVAHGLRRIDETGRPGMQALKEMALVENASVRAIGFRLAPRLNASGRLADARAAVEMLTTDSPERARALAAELEAHNAERRAIEESMMAEAVALLEPRARRDEARSLVAAGDGWHPGVAGIVAARVAERFHRPTLVIALDGDVGRGSGRSVGGVHLHEALGTCADLLDAFGGHRQAVGLTIRRERIPELCERFEAAVSERVAEVDREPRLEVDAEVSFAAVTPALAVVLAALEPHGPGNPEPALLARAVTVAAARPVGDPAAGHVRFRLRQDGRTLPAIGFRLARRRLAVGDCVDVVFTPRLSRWQGLERLELEIVDAHHTGPSNPMQGTDNTQ